jgi:hypothetical protein
VALPVVVGDREERAQQRHHDGTLAHIPSSILILLLVTSQDTMLHNDR